MAAARKNGLASNAQGGAATGFSCRLIRLGDRIGLLSTTGWGGLAYRPQFTRGMHAMLISGFAAEGLLGVRIVVIRLLAELESAFGQ